MAAFANTSGGFLLIGINDNKTVEGIGSELQEIERLYKAASELNEPMIELSYFIGEVQTKKIIVVEVKKSANRPHATLQSDHSQEVYVRANDKTIPVGKTSIQFLSLEIPSNVKNNFKGQAIPKNLEIYLQKNDQITVKLMAKLSNISEYRAEKLLKELARQGVLLFLDTLKPQAFCLK